MSTQYALTGDTMETPFAELIENTSGLSAGVPLGEELLASIAISLKRLADRVDDLHAGLWTKQYSAEEERGNFIPCALCKSGAAFSVVMPTYHVTEYWEGHERSMVHCKASLP